MAGVYRAVTTPGRRWYQGVGVSNPASGCLLFQYLAGGGTLKQATFTDATGASPNANPLVLDANGGLDAAGPSGSSVDIYFSGGVAYRLVLTDASLAPNPGVLIWSSDNLTGENDPAFASPNTGEWIQGPAATWISSAATANGTVIALVGDQRMFYQPNRRIYFNAGGQTLYGRIASAVFAGGITTVTDDMDISAVGVIPIVANPITQNFYGIENAGGANGLGVAMSSASLVLGAKRSPIDGSGRTGIDMFGPIGSNLQTFNAPPSIAISSAGAAAVVASAGGAGNQIQTGTVKGVVGSLEFNKTAHGLTDGQAILVTTTVALPGGITLGTIYFVLLVDANNFGLSASPAGTPLVFVNAGTGNQTLTPTTQIITGTVKGVIGSLNFYCPNHGLRDGELVQLTTGGTLPGGTALATDYIVALVDANNFGLYAKPIGWIYEVPLLAGNAGGGLAWGNPIAFATSGTVSTTITPGWEAPPFIVRNFALICGGGGGGAGGSNASFGGSGGGGGGGQKGYQVAVAVVFVPAIVGAGGLGGVGANGANGIAGSFGAFVGVPGAGGNFGGEFGGLGGVGVSFSGGSGQDSNLSATNALGGLGGSSIYGGGGRGGNASVSVIGTPGSFGSGGGGGYASATVGSNGGAGGAGVIEVSW